MRTSLMALGVGAMSVIGVAGCSSATSTNSAAKSNKSVKAATTDDEKSGSPTTTTQPFVSNSKNTPGTLTNFVGAKHDVHDTKCTHDSASWSTDGKVTNPTATTVRYRIYVSFLNGDTTVALAEVNVGKVGTKKTQDWHQGVKVSGKDLRCVLRVERADL